MTAILNFITHIHTYAGIGMIMLIAGIALIVFATIKLSKLRRLDRNIARAEFNRKFVSDTGLRMSDVEAGATRKAVAETLGIGRRV